MPKNRILEGVIPVVVTPMSSDGSIDHGGLKKLIAYLGEKRIGGYWALGTGSEDMNLSFAKRLEVARTVTEANAGKHPLILGAGFFALDDTMEFIDATKELEFDAYHVMPYHPLLSYDQTEWMYRHIADNSPKPVWLYTSGNWCQPFSPAFVARLKQHPNIAGCKYSSSRTTDQLKVAQLADDEFQIITAVAGQYYLCLTLGSKAGTTSMASAIPDALIEIYDHFKAGDHGAALAAQNKLSSFLDALPKSAKTHNFLGAGEEKCILNLRGICEPYTSSYYVDLPNEDHGKVKALLDEYGYF